MPVEEHRRGFHLPRWRGSVGELMRSLDWRQTELGPPDTWPRSLASYVSMMLEMPSAAILFWGPNQTQLYNDGYAEIMGPRHPAYLARPFAECWPDTYPVIYPWMRRVLDDAEVLAVEDQLYVLTRHGFTEEAYFSFTFSPLRDDTGSIAGIFQPVVETTAAVLATRRGETLRRISAQAEGADAVRGGAMDILAEGDKDIPFSLIYLWDDDQDEGPFSIAAHSGFGALDARAVNRADISRVAREVFETGRGRQIEDVEAALGMRHVGPWPEPTQRACVLPLMRPSADAAWGAVVFGVSPRCHFDETYREFFDSVVRELATNLAAARAKEVEKKLLAREQEARREAEGQRKNLEALLLQAPTPMVLLRGESFIIDLANPDACRLWMRAQEDVAGRPLLEALPELRGQGLAELLERVYRGGETVVGRELRTQLARPEGGFAEVFWNFVYAPLRGAGGEIEGVLVIAFDVTEQVHAREQLTQLKAAAESASLAKDQFFAILGHELRNPLAPILTALQLMRMRGTREVERERQIIERQAEHLVRLVDDLLDVSRVAQGKIELRKEPVELAEVVGRALETTEPILEERQHRLGVQVDKGLVVCADVARLVQAIANLLTNAAKYTDKGGRITVLAERSEGEVVLRIRDTGIGIAPDMLPRLFEDFAQGRQDLARSSGGLGLGLAIVRGIAELHGGSVSAHSEGRGLGSEFVVKLPEFASSDAVPERREARVERPAHEAGRSVLVVEDNRDAADLLAASLEMVGHRVRVAQDGVSALRMATQDPPDVALVDIGLPVMDGYELADRMREVPSLADRPLLAVTGYGEAGARERTLDAGFAAHLVKPVDVSEVDAMIRSVTRQGEA